MRNIDRRRSTEQRSIQPGESDGKIEDIGGRRGDWQVRAAESVGRAILS
jgi:hypothetical protein